MNLSTEAQQFLAALMGGAGMVGLWRLLQFVAGRWFDERRLNAGDDADIRRDQAKRIENLEQRVDELQIALRVAENNAAALEAEVRWLRQTCRPYTEIHRSKEP